MGHKVHPYGFRLGIIKDWKTHWYANNASSYRGLVTEDLELRKTIHNEYKGFSDAGIAKVEIDRGAQDSVINIHSFPLASCACFHRVNVPTVFSGEM